MMKLLINGIDTTLGAQIADLLGRQSPDLPVIGLGRTKPPGPIGRAEWISATLNGRQVLNLLSSEQITTVIHVGFLGIDGPDASREMAVQQNVLGSMELFGACAAAGVKRVVLRSHSWIYGALPTNPMGIEEHREVARSGLHGVVRDFAEVEQFVADFAPRHPYMQICTLRCAPMLGADTPLTTYLSQEGPHMLFGFDPVIQALHVDDAATAFTAAAFSSACGAFNLAADDTLCLSQAIRLAGHQPNGVFEPLVGLALSFNRRNPLADWPYPVDFLRHSCVISTARAQIELGWSAEHSSAAMIAALRTNGSRPDPGAAETTLRTFLSRKGKELSRER